MGLLKELNARVYKITPTIAFNRCAKTSDSVVIQHSMSVARSRFKRFRKQDNFIVEWYFLKISSQHGSKRCSRNGQMSFRRDYSSKTDPELKAEEYSNNQKQRGNNDVSKVVVPPKRNPPLSPEIIKTSKLLGQFYSSLTQRDLFNTWRAYDELIRESKLRYLTRNDYRRMIELVTLNPSRKSENLCRLTTLIDNMKSCKFPLARYDFHAIISYLARSSHRLRRRDVKKALSMFYTMKYLADTQPNITTYNIMLDIAVKASQFEIALQLIHDMTRQGLEPGVKIFTSLIHNFATKCELSKLTGTLDLMSKFGVNPDSYTWNTVIWAYTRSGNLKCAMSIYSKMVSRVKQSKTSQQNPECSPTLPTYHTLLPANILYKDWESVKKLYDDMKFFDVIPTTESYNVILCKFVFALKRDENSSLGEQERKTIKDLVDYISEDMKKYEKVTPSSITFSYLLYLRLLLGDSKKASEILQVMKNNNWKINKALFSDFQNSPS